MRLQDQVCIITGAGSGMGAAMAKLFAMEGAHVIGADIVGEGVEKVIAEAKADGAQGDIRFQLTDVSDKAQVEALLDVATSAFGRLDVLCNNAGIMDNMMPVGEVTDGLWEKVFAINVNGVMYACRKAVDIMSKQETGGRIVNTASVGGLFGSRAGAAYTASKHAVVGLTKNIGFQYATKGIRCNAIAPGGVETNIGAGIRQPSEFGMSRAGIGMSVNPRQGQPEEIAQVALFLASEESSFVNGTVIVADAGWTAY